MNKHTPTPWVKDYGGSFGHIKSVSKSNGCGTNGIRCTPTVARYDVHEFVIPLDQQEANARHIVHCVNNYDRLVEALRGILIDYAPQDNSDVRYEQHCRALLAELDTKGEE